MKSLNQKIGALKRKFKVKDYEPGSFILKVNEMKRYEKQNQIKKIKDNLSKQEVAIRGLI